MKVSPITFARLIAGVSQAELAALADVPASTVSRIERSLVSPSIDTTNRLLATLGQRLSDSTVAVVDLSAIAACRSVLDPTCGLGGIEGVDRWIAAWTRAGLIAGDGASPTPGRLCQMAGMNSKLRSRRSRSIAPIDADQLTRRLTMQRVPYALTGSAAANRIKLVGSETWTVCYVDDLESAAELFDTPPPGGSNALLLELDDVTGVGVAVDSDGTSLADPIQVVIDLYAGVDRMPDQADILAAWFDEQATVDAR